MAVRVLAWRYDHVGDCNRYGNCVVHPFFERPTLEELAIYPDRLPNGSTGLQYVPSDAVTLKGIPEDESGTAFEELRRRASILRAAAGEALHRAQRGHAHEVEQVLGSAISEYDRAWNFAASQR
jgi:hypothetical protein